MGEKLMVWKMVLANRKAPALHPLHSVYNGTPCPTLFTLQAVTAKCVKMFGEFQQMTQEASKNCSFFPRIKVVTLNNKNRWTIS
jgi:hypothetical protein